MSTIINPMTTIGFPVADIEDIRKHAPSAFSEVQSPDVSNRYSFVPTFELIEAFHKLGWDPAYARQVGRGLYGRHVIRLNNPDLGYMDLKSDKVKPQLLLDNSHNGTSSAQIHMGLFRLVCTNGLVVAMPGMYTSVRLRHLGIDMKELKELMTIVAEQYTTVGTHINAMQNHKLHREEQEQFVIKALAAREPMVFINDDGTINMKKATTIINPKDILTPLRGEDTKEDLWTVYNIVQERFVKGEFERRTMNGRRARPRSINQAARNIDFNKKLWELASEYMHMAPELETA